MGRFIRFLSNIAWGGVWLIVGLVIAYGILRIVSQVGGTSIFGRFARSTAHYASASGIAS